MVTGYLDLKVNKLLLILFYIQPVQASTNEIKSFVSLFNPNKKSQKSTIKTSGCKLQEKKWIELLITRESFKEKISFNKDCDLSGEFIVKYGEDFPISFKINNKNFKLIKGLINTKIKFEQKTYLETQLKDFKLTTTKEIIPFTYTHKIEIDIFSTPPIKNDLGGVLKYKDNGKWKVKEMAP